MTLTHIDHTDTGIIRSDLGRLRIWGAQDLNVAVVYGAVSAEDALYIAKSPVEKLSVTAMSESLEALGLRYTVLDPCMASFVADLTRYDVILPNLHGPYGEDGTLQGLCEWLRIPYAYSGVSACAVAADKIQTKRVMESCGVPTPLWTVWREGEDIPWPGTKTVMVKPSRGGSSVGMSLVHHGAGMREALDAAADADPSPVLLEEYVAGQSVTVAMLQMPSGLLTLPPLLTEVTGSEYYDAEIKLGAEVEGGVQVSEAKLSDEVMRRLREHARQLWHVLGLRGGARVDFIVTDTEDVYALEVNTRPGLSRDSNFADAARLGGLGHCDVILALLHEAMARRPYDVPLPRPVLDAA